MEVSLVAESDWVQKSISTLDKVRSETSGARAQRESTFMTIAGLTALLDVQRTKQPVTLGCHRMTSQ